MTSVTQQLRAVYRAGGRATPTPIETDAAPTAPTVTDAAPAPADLASLPIGCGAVLGGFAAGMRPEVARRLFDLGFVPGEHVVPIRRAPLRDPIVYRVGGIEVALRRSESMHVLLAPAL